MGGSLNVGGNVLAPFRYGDKIYFSASVPKKLGTGKVSRLFSTMRNGPATLQTINPKEDETHAAYATLNLAADRIYYTIFKESHLVQQGKSEIWYRAKQYDGTWGNIVALPKHINQSGTINTHPACGYDFLLKKEVLYFASNRPGGKGGFDIWFCTVERDGTFGNPVNLPYNTEHDEVTPHFFTHGQMVFFSSNKPEGKGGFDVYRCEKTTTGTWEAPDNLGAVNSAFDELHFSYHQPTKTSYFCSNRPNDNCQNAPKGCPDFSVFSGILSGSLLVNTRSELDNTALYGCNIELENMETGTIEVTILRSENSTLELPILTGKKYRLIVSRPYFFPVFMELDSSGFDFANPIKKTVYLRPMK